MTWVDPKRIYTTKATIRFKRTSRVLLVPFGLGSTPFVLYIDPYCGFCVFLVKSGDLLSLFSSLSFGGFYFLFLLIVAQLHACVVCIALLTSLAVVLTQGSYFAFASLFYFCF